MPQVDFTLDEVKTEIGAAIKASERRMKRHVTSTTEKSQKEIIEGTNNLVNTVLDAVEEVHKDVRAANGLACIQP